MLMTNCGPDSILVESGVIHSCKIKELDEKIKKDPENKELQEEYIQTVKNLKNVIETEKEENQEEEEGLRKVLKTGLICWCSCFGTYTTSARHCD